MSKISLPFAELKPALTGLGKVIKKHSLPVLTHVKVERTSEGWIALTTTDIDSFATVRFEQPTEGEPFAILVPYEELQRAVKSCTKNEVITVLPTFKNTGSLKYGVAEVEFKTLPVSEFPEIPRIQGQPIPLPESLRTSIHEALECASTDESRPLLNSAFIDVSKPSAHYVVGTNGSHVYASNSFSLPLKESVILPTHAFLDYKGFASDGEWHLKMGAAEGKKKAPVQITSRRWRFICKQHEGTFPDWRHVFPKMFNSTIEIGDPASLIRVVEQLPEYDKTYHSIGLTLQDGVFMLLAKVSHEDPWITTVVSNAKVSGKNVRVFVNRDHLVKALRFGLTRIECVDEQSVVKVSHEGRQMILSPVRHRNEQAGTTQPAANGTGANSPAANPPAAQTNERNNTMPSPTNGAHSKPVDKPTLESALDQIEAVKGSYRDAIKGLNELADTLRQVHRDQKASEREVQSVRTSLQKLQSVRL